MGDSRHTKLWDAFAAGDSSARDALLTDNLSLVHHVARQLGRRLGDKVDHDELVSAGILGLMSAMSAFDPHRGLAFSFDTQLSEKWRVSAGLRLLLNKTP